MGFCDLLIRKTDPDSQAYDDLKTIERQGWHCKKVVENLLSFARLKSDPAEHADLNGCLEEMVAIVAHTLEMNRIELKLDLARQLPPVAGEARQLQQVFLNLINNALAAMEPGGRLTIETRSDAVSRRAVIRFTDTGKGISPHHLDHIFEPFFTTKPEGEGTGLGLFVSYGIITQYGGSLACERSIQARGRTSGPHHLCHPAAVFGQGQMMQGKILIVDDEKDMLRLLERIITEDTGHKVTTACDPVLALDLFKDNAFDLVITDLKMPKMDGIRFLETIRAMTTQTQVVVVTAFATIETAVEAIRKGAYDYITKPFRRERILITVEKVMEWRAMLRENEDLKRSLAKKTGQTLMIGTTDEMKEISQRIRQVAPTTATVLITGKSGVGKEVAAKSLHEQSDRVDKKFVTVNCTAIPEHVMESELFGHVKGAFTGAWKTKKGLVEEAHMGTLFLDEIADLKPALQTKLLRLLQEGEYKPVGSEKTHKADIRFVAATNHDLNADIREKRFREDLYYRLNVVRIHLPPLKERIADIPALSYHFLRKFCAINKKKHHGHRTRSHAAAHGP